MPSRWRILFLLVIGVICLIGVLNLGFISKTTLSQKELNNNKVLPKNQKLVPPVAQFKERVSKKFFGTYVTPTNSPVQPERFKGFHTGVDVEYEDVPSDVPVLAATNGTVVVSEWASGYGGVIVIKHDINGQVLFGIYGHLRPSSMVQINTLVSPGQKIAVLGTGFSSETDGERRHLHFGIAKTNSLLGYTQSLEALKTNWIDPLSLY